MKSVHILILAIIVVVAGFVVGAAGYPRQWEYARLNYDYYSIWSWMSPDVFVEGESVGELCQNLGITSSGEEGAVYTVVDWAGDRGWEMAMVMKVPREYTVMWFKRPR